MTLEQLARKYFPESEDRYLRALALAKEVVEFASVEEREGGCGAAAVSHITRFVVEVPFSRSDHEWDWEVAEAEACKLFDAWRNQHSETPVIAVQFATRSYPREIAFPPTMWIRVLHENCGDALAQTEPSK